MLSSIARGAERIRALAHRLLAFSRPAREEMSPLALNDVIERSLELCQYQIASGRVTLEKTLEPELPRVLGVSNQLETALINLVVNAVHAMGEKGGALRVASRRRGDDVEVAVSDEGPGIPERRPQHLFEPFVTTKPEGKGTGLGLSTVLMVVERHNGHVDFDTRGRPRGDLPHHASAGTGLRADARDERGQAAGAATPRRRAPRAPARPACRSPGSSRTPKLPVRSGVSSSRVGRPLATRFSIRSASIAKQCSPSSLVEREASRLAPAQRDPRRLEAAARHLHVDARARDGSGRAQRRGRGQDPAASAQRGVPAGHVSARSPPGRRRRRRGRRRAPAATAAGRSAVASRPPPPPWLVAPVRARVRVAASLRRRPPRPPPACRPRPPRAAPCATAGSCRTGRC